MKQIFTLLSLLALAFSASAQVTLDMPTHPANPGVIERNFGLKPGSVYIPAPGTKQTYDYRTAILSGDSIPARVYIKTTDTISFPGSNRYFDYSASFAGLSLNIDFYEANTTKAHSEVGFALPFRQAYDISGFTGTKGDSIIFPKQHHLYKNAHTILQYPAGYGSNWSYTDRVVTNFLFNAHYGVFINYNNAPSTRVQNVTHKDSILAWGKALVPFGSAGSAAYNVLVVKSWDKVNDSMYINNAPANPLILTAIGRTNGQDTFTYEYKFYRPYVSNPFVVIQTDAAYSKILAVYYDPNNVDTTGIEELIAPVSAVKTYPNPTKDGSFTLEFNKLLNGVYAVNIMNALGQPIQNENVSGIGFKQMHIQLPLNAGGVYFYTITNTAGKSVYSGKVIDSK